MYKIVKRLLDIVIASIGIIIVSPLLLVIMIVLLFTGEHKVFFFQRRVGYKNRIFYIWKFATMLKNSVNMGTGAITLRNDPRVTRVGRFLRRSKLNELPQLFNVLKGDMTFVGPRPLMSVSFDLYPPDVQKKIYNIRPGITGIGSIIFRDEEKIVSESTDIEKTYELIYADKARLEMWYQRKESLLTDLTILLITCWIIFVPQSRIMYKVFPDLPISEPYIIFFREQYLKTAV